MEIPDKNPTEILFAKEYWTGDSRDGKQVNSDGYHYYRMQHDGLILEAFEYYESDDGLECVSKLPEMLKVNWFNDLGFDDFEVLDSITESDFNRVKELSGQQK